MFSEDGLRIKTRASSPLMLGCYPQPICFSFQTALGTPGWHQSKKLSDSTYR